MGASISISAIMGRDCMGGNVIQKQQNLIYAPGPGSNM